MISRVFVSYAGEDAALCDYFVSALSIAERLKNDELTYWVDTLLDTGRKFDADIQSKCQASTHFLLLLSNSWLNSDYILDTEFRIAMQRYQAKAALLFPVKVRQVNNEFIGAKFRLNLLDIQYWPKKCLRTSDHRIKVRSFEDLPEQERRSTAENLVVELVNRRVPTPPFPPDPDPWWRGFGDLAPREQENIVKSLKWPQRFDVGSLPRNKYLLLVDGVPRSQINSAIANANRLVKIALDSADMGDPFPYFGRVADEMTFWMEIFGNAKNLDASSLLILLAVLHNYVPAFDESIRKAGVKRLWEVKQP